MQRVNWPFTLPNYCPICVTGCGISTNLVQAGAGPCTYGYSGQLYTREAWNSSICVH
jgi:hypothetical protein